MDYVFILIRPHASIKRFMAWCVYSVRVASCVMNFFRLNNVTLFMNGPNRWHTSPLAWQRLMEKNRFFRMRVSLTLYVDVVECVCVWAW